MDYLLLMRPHQWIKNLFVLLPAFIAGSSATSAPWVSISLCFVAFCLASSSIYVVNDIFDAKRDRIHPLKKNRPIARGVVSAPEGWILSGCLMVVSFVIAYFASRSTLGFVAVYILLNLAYSSWTKHVPVLDCASIALGFCLRFLAGGVGFQIAVNPRLLTACYFGALALALVKRRIELSLVATGATASRPSLKGLSLQALDLLVGLFGATAVALYAEWTLSSGHPLAVFTLPLLSIAISRVVWLAYLSQKGEDFAKTLMSDTFSLVSTLLFLGMLGAAVYS